ncbi:hypothetical protein AVEN_223690-1 [Araneus ventricosus]|uniref:Uncharacterized protein n=1 Tax=Araneus ventricosus TaxID=182803 RepID=A0A4Y2BH44_ARAVE|nr:hypothetical protein AVEN_223690-1 [Araneus ventricosus]
MGHDGRNMGKDTPRQSPMTEEMPRACGHQCTIGNNCSSQRVWTSMSTMHRETSYTSRVNRNFRCFEKKRQYKHRNGDDCITLIFSDASKIGTVLVSNKRERLLLIAEHLRLSLKVHRLRKLMNREGE